MNADGSAQTRLTTNRRLRPSPIFSPNGQKIAFTSTRDGNSEIYADERRRLLPGQADD